MKNLDIQTIKHINEYCGKLLSFTDGMSFAEFDKGDLLKDASALNLLQIGELVSILSDEFKEKHSSIPWRQIRSMRNIVAHHYGVIDSETVWETIQDDIPKLKKFCENILI